MGVHLPRPPAEPDVPGPARTGASGTVILKSGIRLMGVLFCERHDARLAHRYSGIIGV